MRMGSFFGEEPEKNPLYVDAGRQLSYMPKLNQCSHLFAEMRLQRYASILPLPPFVLPNWRATRFFMPIVLLTPKKYKSDL